MTVLHYKKKCYTLDMYRIWPSELRIQGRIQDFKLGGGGGAHLKKLRRAEGGGKNVGLFRVKKITILSQKIIFFPI